MPRINRWLSTDEHIRLAISASRLRMTADELREAGDSDAASEVDRQASLVSDLYGSATWDDDAD